MKNLIYIVALAHYGRFIMPYINSNIIYFPRAEDAHLHAFDTPHSTAERRAGRKMGSRLFCFKRNMPLILMRGAASMAMCHCF